jgi:superfamily II DNA/RNA helicase
VAFAIPTVVALSGSGDGRQAKRPRALVLVPTRELASQVADTLVPLARAAGLRVATVYGGVSQGPQVKALREGVDIVVACPGRLEDLIGQGHCRLDNVRVAVLDEADHMADLGFLPSVKRLLDATPSDGQRLLFSATLDRGVDILVRRYLNNPVTHSVDSAESPVPDMVHHVMEVSSGDKAAVVRELASGSGRSLLFTRTKYGAKKLAEQLAKQGIPSVELHGNLSQAARARNLAAYSDGRARVLVATDIAARGIHVDEIGIVVHVDPPAEHKAFSASRCRSTSACSRAMVSPDSASV